MFPRGWDRGWESRVRSATVTTSSCLEASRKDGGARALLTWVSRSFVDRSEFCASLLTKFDTGLRPSLSFARIALAPCAGKTRIVSINSVDSTWLSPYHSLIYGRLSRMDWCLRGEAKASCFSDFVQKDGEVFVSGDYESATDNLNQDVARSILETIGRSCSRVPLFVREAALRTLGGFLTDGKTGVVQRRGQLMGNQLSFPLLCLQNYLAFRYLVKRDVPFELMATILFSGPALRNIWCGSRVSNPAASCCQPVRRLSIPIGSPLIAVFLLLRGPRFVLRLWFVPRRFFGLWRVPSPCVESSRLSGASVDPAGLFGRKFSCRIFLPTSGTLSYR